MAKKIIKLGQETDWATAFGLYAMNDATKLFENTSWTEGLVAEVYDTDSNDEVSDHLDARIYKEKKNIVFLLYTPDHFLAGFVYADEEEDEGPKEVKKVFRFHAHTWTDVVVTGTTDLTEEEWYDLANDKYNEGDYEEDPDNFENTDVEEITDYLKENKIYPFND
jgi:hypothetical protein